MSAPIVHLVGSVPLADAETVFRTVCGAVGPHLARLPDGETGDRQNWITKIRLQLAEHPDFEPDPDEPPYRMTQWDGRVLRESPLLRFGPGVDPDQVVFDTGYARAAQESFATFERLRNDGVIPEGARFQICLPTPLATTYACIAPRARPDYARVFGRHMTDEVAAIARALPPERIAIQWDVCQEVLAWEGYFGPGPQGEKDMMIATLAGLGDAVPEPVELGYHLCYGSPADEHLLQPKDMGVMVEMTNRLVPRVGRSIQFIHMPVPKDRSDEAYFAPLDRLRLGPETALYLGLVHFDDAAGDAARLAAARRHATVGGIGSECGWGRTDPARVPGLLAAHRALAAAG